LNEPHNKLFYPHQQEQQLFHLETSLEHYTTFITGQKNSTRPPRHPSPPNA
jgi:hypothetical protein